MRFVLSVSGSVSMCLKCGCLFSFKTVLTQVQRPFCSSLQLNLWYLTFVYVCVCVFTSQYCTQKLNKSDKMSGYILKYC